MEVQLILLLLSTLLNVSVRFSDGAKAIPEQEHITKAMGPVRFIRIIKYNGNRSNGYERVLDQKANGGNVRILKIVHINSDYGKNIDDSLQVGKNVRYIKFFPKSKENYGHTPGEKKYQLVRVILSGHGKQGTH